MEMLAIVGSGVRETFFLITWKKFQHIYNADRDVLKQGKN